MEYNIKNFGVGLQLYTIRDAMSGDPLGSLKKVSDLGFKYLEICTNFFLGLFPNSKRK